jgi:hypothetical protein
MRVSGVIRTDSYEWIQTEVMQPAEATFERLWAFEPFDYDKEVQWDMGVMAWTGYGIVTVAKKSYNANELAPFAGLRRVTQIIWKLDGGE